jgi:hypothetical protein
MLGEDLEWRTLLLVLPVPSSGLPFDLLWFLLYCEPQHCLLRHFSRLQRALYRQNDFHT